MSEAVDILMRLKGGRSAAHETRQVGDEIGRLGRKARTSGEQAHKSGKAYEYATQRMRLFGHAAVGVREHTLGLATAALGLSAGIFGLEHVVSSSVAAWGEQRRTLAQTNAVLKSTGGAAGVTAAQVEKLAEAQSKQTGIQSDVIAQAENMLLTFRGVRNAAGANGKVFTRTAKAAINMSAAFTSAGKSMSISDAALQIGKAMNNPAKGITRLTRMGVEFSAQQIANVKAFSAFGDTARAQAIILRELNKEFGGSAAAVATPGMKLRATVHQIQETFGKGLQPAIDAVDKKLLHLADKALPYVSKAADDVSKVFGRKDLNLGQKLTMSAKVARRDLTPLWNSIRRSVRQWNPGQKVENAVSWVMPRLANGFGQGAPRVAWAFVKGFINASVWGKLATLGFLFWKFGAIRSIGTKLATVLAGGMVTRLAATETGVAIAAGLGTGAKSTAALAGMASIGRVLGRALGGAAVLAISFELAQWFAKHHPNDPSANTPWGKFLHTLLPLQPSPGLPNIKPYTPKPGAPPYHRDSGPLRITGTPMPKKAPGTKASPFHPSTHLGELPKSKRHTSGFRIDSPHPSLAGVLRIDNHHHIYVDGKEMTAVLAPNLTKGDNPKWVSEAVGKQVANRKARK